ncbi:class I SAM-dependent methyltransferase [Thermococcus sp. M39]|uniref:class I SAM-dependent methyltransferase n=1 Tax=Thermococcus sp. M39 TaxID=1638262 RepID=UPI00143939D3|nr:class I SAM-dependent methyltransferase [Thermococcus sp. M39]NJE08350.1 class I SAM-dependent methyltransferase [Thermococcus sp. M39]
MSLEELYEFLHWPMHPDDEGARKRFEKIVRVFSSLIEDRIIESKEEIAILDLAAGTGIAGVALAKVLGERGVKVELTAVDLREKDLHFVDRWIKAYEVKNAKANTVTADIRELHRYFEESHYDVAMLWGLTMPHFDPFETIKIFANVSYALKEDGIFLMEESDRVFNILYRVGYRDFLVETKTEEYTLISVHEGYNLKRGTFKRTYYKIPGFEKVSEDEHRLWDIAGILGIGSIFFKDFKLITKMEHEVFGVSDVLVFKNPRKNLPLNEFLEG